MNMNPPSEGSNPGHIATFLWAVLVISFTWSSPQAGPAASPPAFLYASFGSGPGTAYSRPLGIFFDRSRGECYVADTGNHQIVVCNSDGIPVYRFVHYTGEGGKLIPGEPRSVAVDRLGRIFVTDATASYIDVLDYRGSPVTRIDPPGQTKRFDFLALGPDGSVYATVSGERKAVCVIGDDLGIAGTIELELMPGEKPSISAMALDGRGNIYIADPGAEIMIQIFDPRGRYLRGFGKHDTGFNNFSFPSGLAVMDDGRIWVKDALRQVAVCFSSRGEFLTYIGGKGVGPGAFNYPSGITTDGSRLIFVLERVGRRYQCFEIADGLKEEVNDVNELSTSCLTKERKGGETQ